MKSPLTSGGGADHWSSVGAGRGGVIAVLCKMHWAGLSEPSWEQEMDPPPSRSHILRYWAGTPDQPRQPNRLYR